MTIMRIAVFDLDGTVTRRDTFMAYALGFCLRHPWRLPRLWVVPWHLLVYLAAGRDRGRLKQALIKAAFKGVSRAQIKRWNGRFVPRLLERQVRPQARAQIEAHRAHGDYLILMSASPDLYVPDIARALGMNEAICTGVRWNGMRLDGELTTPNRRGEEKLRCVEMLRRRHPGCKIAGYGNAASDLPHLRACDQGSLVNASRAACKQVRGLGVSIGWE